MMQLFVGENKFICSSCSSSDLEITLFLTVKYAIIIIYKNRKKADDWDGNQKIKA